MRRTIMIVAAVMLATGCTEPETARDRDPAQALEVRSDRALYLATALDPEQAADEERARQGERIAVHTAFPFNVLLRLTNDDTGAQVDVRVADAGPFMESRQAPLDPDPVIRVSPAAAGELGAGPGERVPVWVEVLEW